MLIHFRSFLLDFMPAIIFSFHIWLYSFFFFFFPFSVVHLLPWLQPDLAEGEVIKQDIMELKEGLNQQVSLHYFSHFCRLYN